MSKHAIFLSIDEQRMSKMTLEERNLREENVKLQETLRLEKERSERLCRALSESESSLDGSLIDWDRYSSASGYDYLRDTHPRQDRNISLSGQNPNPRSSLSTPLDINNPTASPKPNVVRRLDAGDMTGPYVAATLAPTSHSQRWDNE